MMTKRLFPALCLAALATSCSSYRPLPVDETNIESRLSSYKNANGEIGLSVASNTGEAVENMKTYADWYSLKSTELQEKLYNHSDYSLGFGVAGLIAGAAGSPEGAALGALFASSSTIPVERYALSIQAQNYQKASDTLYCIYRHLAPYKGNDLLLPEFAVLNDAIYQLRLQLRKLQASITLADPDMDKLQSSLIKLKQDETDVESKKSDYQHKKDIKASKANQLKQKIRGVTQDHVDKADSEAIRAKIDLNQSIQNKNESKVQTCLATFVS